MSRSHKRSLWQKIKQLLTTSTVQPEPAINDIEVSKSLPITDFDNELDSNANVSEVQTDNDSLDSNCIDRKNADNEDGKVKNNNAIHNSVEAKASISSNFDNITEQNDAEHTPIIDCLKRYFNNKQWHYNYYQPKARDRQQSHYLSLRVRHEQLDCGYLFRVQEENKLLAVYGILPFLIPESYQSAATRLITQINHDMLVGSLEMDNSDGEIRYKSAINVEAAGIDDHTIEQLLQSVIAMITVVNKLFSNLIDNQNPDEEL